MATMFRGGCAALTLGAVMAAQAVHVVDALGGPGTFPTLAAAEAIAANGDTIVVVPTGIYDFGLTTNKGLVIVGQGPGAPLFHGRLVVTNLPFGQQFVLRNFVSSVAPQVGQVGIAACQGRVVLDSLALVAQPAGIACHVHGSFDVSMHLSYCLGSPALAVYGANFVASDCTFAGAPTGGLGFDALGSTAWLTRCAVSGPAVGMGLSTAMGLPSWVWMAGGSVVSGTATAPPLVATAGSGVLVDASTVLAGAMQYLAPGTVVPFESGRAALQLQPANGTAGFDGPSGAFGALFLALPGPRMPTPLGDLFADATNAVLLAAGQVPLSSTFALPSPAPTAQPLVAQGVLMHLGTLRLSLPVRTVLP
jgi:hypothetical protein